MKKLMVCIAVVAGLTACTPSIASAGFFGGFNPLKAITDKAKNKVKEATDVKQIEHKVEDRVKDKVEEKVEETEDNVKNKAVESLTGQNQ